MSTGTDFPGKACTSILLSPIGVCKMDLYNISEFRSAYLSIGQLKCRTPPFHLYLCDVFDAVQKWGAGMHTPFSKSKSETWNSKL